MDKQIDTHIQISIIIPAYNAAKYLERCIESVVYQDLPTDCYEAIVINDGSTDNTIEMLDSFSSKYPFLRYVTTSNGGLSRARNRGMVEARGEYLIFLDSDDSITPNTLSKIYKEMSENQLDMMLMNYHYISKDGDLLEIPFRMDENSVEVISGREFLFKDNYPPMVWIYAYRHSFLIENELCMIPIWHEDEEFTPRAIYLARWIKYYPLSFYNYFRNTDSYMNQYQESNFLYIIEAMGSLNKFKQTHCRNNKDIMYFDNHIAITIMRLFKKSIRQGCQNQMQMIESIKEINLLPLKPTRRTFNFYLFNISPSVFERYYRIIKRKPKHG